jgi:hypothetical protein
MNKAFIAVVALSVLSLAACAQAPVSGSNRLPASNLTYEKAKIERGTVRIYSDKTGEIAIEGRAAALFFAELATPAVQSPEEGSESKIGDNLYCQHLIGADSYRCVISVNRAPAGQVGTSADKAELERKFKTAQPIR